MIATGNSVSRSPTVTFVSRIDSSIESIYYPYVFRLRLQRVVQADRFCRCRSFRLQQSA